MLPNPMPTTCIIAHLKMFLTGEYNRYMYNIVQYGHVLYVQHRRVSTVQTRMLYLGILPPTLETTQCGIAKLAMAKTSAAKNRAPDIILILSIDGISTAPMSAECDVMLHHISINKT